MGTNRLNTNFNAGDKITDQHVKQFADALTGDVVGRDELGRPSDQQKAGTGEYPFDEVNTKRLNVGGRAIFPELVTSSKYQIIRGATYRAPIGEVPDDTQPTVRQKVDMGWPLLLRPSVDGKRIYLHASELSPFQVSIDGVFVNITSPIHVDLTATNAGFPSLGVSDTNTAPPSSIVGPVTESHTSSARNFQGERVADFNGEIDFATSSLALNFGSDIALFNRALGVQTNTVGSLTFKDRRIYAFCHCVLSGSTEGAGLRLYSTTPSVGPLEHLAGEPNGILSIGRVRRNIGFIRRRGVTVSPTRESDIMPENAIAHVTEDATYGSNDSTIGAINTICVGLTVFLNQDSELTLTARRPIRSPDEPADAELNDYWYNTKEDQWNRHNGVDWAETEVVPVGIAYFNGQIIVGVESFHFDRSNRTNYNTVRGEVGLQTIPPGERVDTINYNTARAAGRVVVNGKTVDFYGEWGVNEADGPDDATAIINLPAAPDFVVPGQGLPTGRGGGDYAPTASPMVYFYVTQDGAPVYDTKRPQYSELLQGHYHPYMMARCVGSSLFSFYDPEHPRRTELPAPDPSELNPGLPTGQHSYEGLTTDWRIHFHEKYNHEAKKEFVYSSTMSRLGRDTTVINYGKLEVFPNVSFSRTFTFSGSQNASDMFLALIHPSLLTGTTATNAIIIEEILRFTRGTSSRFLRTEEPVRNNTWNFLGSPLLNTNVAISEGSFSSRPQLVTVQIVGAMAEQFILDNEIK